MDDRRCETVPSTKFVAASNRTDSRHRLAVIFATEHTWWREVNRAQLGLVSALTRLEFVRATWDARIATAMRGVDPPAWWRCSQRIEAGELWVGGNAKARWVQRVVYATRTRVLTLAGQRDARLAPLEATCAAADGRLRGAIRPLVTAFGVRETARRLGLPEPTVSALVGSAPLTPADYRVLGCRTETSCPGSGEKTNRREDAHER